MSVFASYTAFDLSGGFTPTGWRWPHTGDWKFLPGAVEGGGEREEKGKGREGEGKDPHCFLDKSNHVLAMNDTIGQSLTP